jgi:hypothetical protein
MWKTYLQLSEVEAAFRIHKSELTIRPIWHQREDRVQAHILVYFLAYVLWKTLEQWQLRAGLGNSPRTILDELGRIQSTDVVRPLADDLSREIRIRCVIKPEQDCDAARPSRTPPPRAAPLADPDRRHVVPTRSAKSPENLASGRRTAEVRLA